MNCESHEMNRDPMNRKLWNFQLPRGTDVADLLQVFLLTCIPNAS